MSKDKKSPVTKNSSFKSFLKARSFRRGALAVLITSLVIAAVVLLNVILAAVTNRYPVYWDVTENASFQLQPDTQTFVAAIDQPVSIYVLQKESNFESGDSANYQYYIQANKLIRNIAAGNDQIELHYVDLTSDPTFTKDYPNVDWTQSHLALIVCEDRYRTVELTDVFTYDEQQYQYYGTYVINGQHVEQAFMTAILNVTNKEKTKVTVLSGQGEKDMTPFTTLLENNAFEVETISLLNESISTDSQFLIIYVPEVDIEKDDYTTISDWLTNGEQYGHHLIYFPNDQHSQTEYPNLNALVAEYGMELRDGYVFETAQDHLIPGYEQFISVYNYYTENNTFTKGLRSLEIPVVMSMTMPIDITDSSMAQPLLTSTDKAYFLSQAEDDNADLDPEELNGAAIGQHSDGTENGASSSIVVIGSYDAVTKNYLSINSFNNAAYFVNLINTLSDRSDSSVVIEGKDPTKHDLGITTIDAIAFPAIVVRYVIPICVLLAGIVIWILRRFR